MKSRILSIIILLGSFGLLTYLRLNEPKQPSAYQINGSEIVRRGTDMHTGPGEMKAFQVQGTEIYLAENTTVTLIDSWTVPKLAIREGRLVTKGPVKITVRDTMTPAEGTATFVFYSWLEKLDVVEITTEMAYSVDTLNNSTTQQPYNFDPQKSSAHDFYNWALETN